MVEVRFQEQFDQYRLTNQVYSMRYHLRGISSKLDKKQMTQSHRAVEQSLMERLSTAVKEGLRKRIREGETPRGYQQQEACSPEREREFQIELWLLLRLLERFLAEMVPSVEECLLTPGQEESWLPGKYSRFSSYVTLTSCQWLSLAKCKSKSKIKEEFQSMNSRQVSLLDTEKGEQGGVQILWGKWRI